MARGLRQAGIDDEAVAVLHQRVIVAYKEHLDRTRHELTVVMATLTLFQRDGHRLAGQPPAHVRNLFRRGEALTICKTALAETLAGMTTRELAIALPLP